MALHLYYDSKKGLVKAQNYAVGNYIMEHDEKGWDAPHHEQVLEIPSQNVKIMVNTNLGWGPKSYMYARISMMDKIVLNFFDTTLRYPVNMVCVKPGDWNELFDSIIKLYNSIYNSEAPINDFFDMIEETIKADCTIDKMVYVTTRLSEISEMVSTSIYADSRVIKMRLRRVCKMLFQNIEENCGKVSLVIKGEETREEESFKYKKAYLTVGQQNKIEANLKSILIYLAERNEILDVFSRKDQRTFAGKE